MPVKYGIMGCGAIGQRRHIPEVAADPRAKVVALCDINKARVQQIADKYNAQAYTDHRQMLKEADIDAVIIGTPNYLHAPQSLDAFRAGKHVLVEKPMACTRAQAKAMINAAKKAGKFLMVGQNQRLMPPHAKAKQILDSGVLGKVLNFRTAFKHSGPENWSVDGVKSWFFNPDQAVMGVTGDLGVHKADLMRWLLGEEFVEVAGFTATRDKKGADGRAIALDDNAYFSLRSASGVIGTMMISWTGYGGGDNSTCIYCKYGCLTLGGDPAWGVMVDYRNGNRERYAVGAMATNEKQTDSGVASMMTTAILENRKPEIDGWEGYRSLNVILTAMEAAKQGRTLKIKE